MDMQSTLLFQIIADVVLCLAIAFLLMRLPRAINQAKAPVIDEKSFFQFRQLLAESQINGERFFRTIDEGYRKFQELAIGLEIQEEKLRVLVEEIKKITETVDLKEHLGDEKDCKKKYESIMNFLKEGFPLEEIAERTGITSGEIALIVDLEKIKKREHQAG
jgi:hypothetical protein